MIERCDADGVAEAVVGVSLRTGNLYLCFHHTKVHTEAIKALLRTYTENEVRSILEREERAVESV